ncbi:hypothetical protein LTR08_008759 [Meristemomyces frigidus]|nr:hypothetical protein LTR08_008759 [Meristemomyces frigidus]
MPSSRRWKVVGLFAFIAVLTLFYITNGAKSTYNSQFYTRTVAAMQNRQDTAAREDMMAQEKQRLDRVERLQKEHDVAVAAAATSSSVVGGAAANGAQEKQRPLAAGVQEAAGGAAGAAKAVVDKIKPVAGRKTMSDKVVQTKPATASDDDGVAKVGNVNKVAANSEPGSETEQDHKVEIELNDILKQGPIIIFSKSYCPYSMKAKHILLDLYTITPAPYVVELDQHHLGPGLQSALQKSTGRRTVPNVLINGKSIGGGDDIAGLHESGKLAETVRSMGGKRVVSVVKKEASVGGNAKRAVGFQA